MSAQTLSNKAEKRWNHGVSIALNATDDFLDVAGLANCDPQLIGDLAASIQQFDAAVSDVCAKARACAASGGVTINSAPGPKKTTASV